jgi:cyclopropane-fatty-acyl-phospholipid synthase
MNAKEKAHELLLSAGITIDGPAPTDPQVQDERVFDRIFSSGSMGAGESYMDGWWDVEDPSGFFTKIFQAELHAKLQHIGTLWYIARSYVLNLQSKSRAFEVGEQHYDIGNDLYERMLDKRMVYTCGYWSGTPAAQNLDEAQEAKLDLICKKIGLQKGHTVLDVGCGWGSFAKFAAEKYGAEVVGITVSEEQVALARERCKGLPVEIRLEDYRDTRGSFDRIVSVGMFEHVGYKNYGTYMRAMKSLLKDDGLFLLHTIGSSVTMWYNDAWVDKYIFPGGLLPSVAQIGKAIDRQFVVEDWHNFGDDYDKTLMAWHNNVERAWPELGNKYSERFRRMWRYYLLSSAAMFRSRGTHLWQIVLSKRGVPGGYKSVR